ncbi:MAG TPA: radical SAM family heme chaperone HemW [Polyangia bacterium]|jgi:oxygen-independent coproporphyrinogen-3 oxidase|nr:radical SAM family heme chaperone HemW [Polyangia bacterium]
MAALTTIDRRRRAAETIAALSAGDLAPAGEVGLYVHFPFCSVHCPYCDFAVDARADIPHDRYADAVIAEIAARAPWFRRAGEATPRLVSIYFGGGTPGLWNVDALARVIEAGRAAFSVDPAASLEITVEANPGEVDEARVAAWRRAGVNRLSLGLQSFDDAALVALGRNHDAAAGPTAVRTARAQGIDNLSVDLMFGLPGQTQDDWQRSLGAALALGSEHVSAYALTIERGTIFGARARKGELIVPDAEPVAAMQQLAQARLAAAGLAQYEVSSYARPGQRAVHNSLYWSGAPYLGVGASAASFRPLADGTGWRFSNPRATDTYLRAVEAGALAPAQFERREPADLENEAVWLALRTADGLERAAHAARFGIDPLVGREAAIDGCVAAGWLEVTPRALHPTPLGLLFADEIAARLWR